MKIVFCGGHHNSALLVAEALKEKGYEIYWFGHKYSMIGDRNPSAEYLEVTKKEIPFIEINAGKWQPKYKFVHNLLRIPIGFWQSFFWLIKIKPKLIFSFGGYLALPIAIMGWFLGIIVITHEQTVVSGVANKIIALVAKKIFVSFELSMKYFNRNKVVLTGLPIRPALLLCGKKLFDNEKKTIYITGGKQGAHIINQAIFQILPRLLEKFNIIHQCGSTSLFNDIHTAEQLKCSLDKNGQNYLVNEYFFDSEIGDVFSSADFVISRAGAHTIYELIVLEKPAILIPIPWSNKNEQEENGKLMVSLGLAKILSQDNLANIHLFDEIITFDRNLKKYRLNSKSAVKINATETIVAEIEKLLN